jgi:hypothetical protein
MAGVLIVVAVGMGVLTLREPRFNGRTAAEWLEVMGPVPIPGTGKLRDHEVRRSLESVRAEILPMIEREFRRAAFAKTSSRDWFHKKTYFYVVLMGRLFPNRLGLSPPEVPKAERVQGERLYWSTALIMDLSPDLVSGLARFDFVADTVPFWMRIEASTGFGGLSDDQGRLTAALVERLEASGADPERRALWISCLGHLGEQASSAADRVRSLTRDTDPHVRRTAIQALGSIDPREDVIAFIQACATDDEGRRAAMQSFLRMGARAQPAEGFIRDMLKDPDMWTSMYAKWVLDALSGTNGTEAGVSVITNRTDPTQGGGNSP